MEIPEAMLEAVEASRADYERVAIKILNLTDSRYISPLGALDAANIGLCERVRDIDEGSLVQADALAYAALRARLTQPRVLNPPVSAWQTFRRGAANSAVYDQLVSQDRWRAARPIFSEAIEQQEIEAVMALQGE